MTLGSVLLFTVCRVVVQHAGDLGNIVAGPDGRASFRLEDSQLKVTQTWLARLVSHGVTRVINMYLRFREQRCHIVKPFNVSLQL